MKAMRVTFIHSTNLRMVHQNISASVDSLLGDITQIHYREEPCYLLKLASVNSGCIVIYSKRRRCYTTQHLFCSGDSRARALLFSVTNLDSELAACPTVFGIQPYPVKCGRFMRNYQNVIHS
jgi:hypothetical protein